MKNGKILALAILLMVTGCTDGCGGEEPARPATVQDAADDLLDGDKGVAEEYLESK